MINPYLPNLTALRGIAAILVATMHFHFFLGGIVPYKNAGMVDKLYLMVDLFFIISGFIMCYVYEAHFTEGLLKTKYKNFIIARLARIYPLHVFSLSVELVICFFLISLSKFQLLPSWHQHLYRFDAIPIQLLFLQTIGIFNFDTWNAPAWSLSAEWWAYVFFPFLFLFFQGIGYKKWHLTFGIALFGWLNIEYVLAPLQPFMNHPPNPKNISLDVNWYFGTIRGLVGFIAGMSIWQLYKQSKFEKLLSNGWSLLVLVMGSVWSMQYKLSDTITVVLFSIVILSTAYGSKSIDRFYKIPIFKKLGEWSFSIYMWHMVLINMVTAFFIMNRTNKVKGILRPIDGSYLEKWAFLLIFLISVSCIGYLSHRYIETPTRRYIKTKFS